MLDPILAAIAIDSREFERKHTSVVIKWVPNTRDRLLPSAAKESIYLSDNELLTVFFSILIPRNVPHNFLNNGTSRRVH